MRRNIVSSAKRNLHLAIRGASVLESHEPVEDVVSEWINSRRAHGTRLWSVNFVYLKCMQFLLYFLYFGLLKVVFFLKQPISAFIRGTGGVSQLMFPSLGVITVKEQQNQERFVFCRSAFPNGDRVCQRLN